MCVGGGGGSFLSYTNTFKLQLPKRAVTNSVRRRLSSFTYFEACTCVNILNRHAQLSPFECVLYRINRDSKCAMLLIGMLNAISDCCLSIFFKYLAVSSVLTVKLDASPKSQVLYHGFHFDVFSSLGPRIIYTKTGVFLVDS